MRSVPLKILWLAHFVPFPPRGGALQRSYHLLRYLARHHHVKLLALNQRNLLGTPHEVDDAKQALVALGISIQIFEIPADHNRLTRVAMAGSGLIRREAFHVRWLRSASFSEAVAASLASERFDLVHVDTIGLLSAIGNVPSGLPIVLNHHNIESQMMRRRAEKEGSFPRRWYFRHEARKLERLERDRCPGMATNLVVSELDGERLRSVAPGGRVAVVENGVDPEFFQPASASSPGNALVFSGTMGWYPNHDAMTYFLRDIWPLLVRQDPEMRLTVVGKQPRQELKRRSALDPRVTLTGAVEDVRPYLRAAGIYVCPIRDGGGTRLKILDALASGLPLVATTLAVEGLALEPGRHFLAADTPEDFARAVFRLRDDSALRRRLAQEGRRLVEDRYSWTAIGAKLEGAYGAAIEASGATTPIAFSRS